MKITKNYKFQNLVRWCEIEMNEGYVWQQGGEMGAFNSFGWK